MTVIVDRLDLGLGRRDRLLAFDLSPSGAAIVAVDSGSRSVVRFPGGGEVAVPQQIGHVILAAISDDTAIVTGPRTSRERPNAWIITPGGRQRPFFVGDAVEDVLALRNGTIATTYFDEGFGQPISEEGIAVFGTDGAYHRGYAASTGRSMMDCYAAVAVGSSGVAVWPYPDWHLVIWDTVTGVERTHVVPGSVRGASAIAHAGDRWWFFSPYNAAHRIYEWAIGSSKVSKVGEATGPLRGLPGGRFLEQGEAGPAILTMT